jgi:hypothetical protein
MDVQPVESVGVGDRFGGRPQGCCAAQAAVGTLLVVEHCELGACVEQMGLVPDQGAVE